MAAILAATPMISDGEIRSNTKSKLLSKCPGLLQDRPGVCQKSRHREFNSPSGRLLTIFGELKLAITGLACEMIAYVLIGFIAFIPSPLFIWAGIVFFTVGSGLLEPLLGGLLSRAAGPRQQGIVMGGNQSLESLARILGPLWGGVLYVSFGHASPYLSAAVFAGLAILATSLAIPSLQTHLSVPNTPQSRKT